MWNVTANTHIYTHIHTQTDTHTQTHFHGLGCFFSLWLSNVHAVVAVQSDGFQQRLLDSRGEIYLAGKEGGGESEKDIEGCPPHNLGLGHSLTPPSPNSSMYYLWPLR